MAECEQGYWKNITKYGKGPVLTVTLPSIPKVAMDVGLKAAGGYACYLLGTWAGGQLNHMPHLNELIPQAVNTVSNIDVKGHLDGLFGLLGVIYGVSESGTTVNKTNLDRLEKICLAPIKLTMRDHHN